MEGSKIITVLLLVISFYGTRSFAQNLKPGFDKAEYINLMKLSAQFGDSAYQAAILVPEKFELIYRSPIVGLDNLWELWTENEETAIINIRGTTENSESWLANFYAAMVPAKGSLVFTNNESFEYELANNPKAAVHVGWLLSTAFLAKDIIPKIDSSYAAGLKDFLIIGHSQGGAIAYLLTAHLLYLQAQGAIPADIQFKTYCSAAPKPGNLYFAYDYEAQTQNGWAYNVVNSADWVPENPISIQTLDDFNDVNPFKNVEEVIKKEKFSSRLAMKYAYRKLYRPTKKAQKNYQKILGDITSKRVAKLIPGFEAPVYYESNHYVRTGNTVVLLADEDYYQIYPNDEKKIFMHHFHPPYLHLAEKLNIGSSDRNQRDTSDLEGGWELEFMSGAESDLGIESLFPNKMPVLTLNLGNRTVNGNTGCNNFNGKLEIEDNKIKFPEYMSMTRMMCEGEGERQFLNTLKIVESYSVSKNQTLTFFSAESPILRFKKIYDR